LFWLIVGSGAPAVRRPNSAMDNPVRESSSTSQRAKIILGTPPSNGVSAGQVKGFGSLTDVKIV